ncbi:MAG: SGNH/GDSL hydrolase family protein [Puniceicoccales bacterium]
MKSVCLVLSCLVLTTAVFADSARDAWEGLVKPKQRKDPAYAYVENDPSLPNVLIYGDSISIHYTPTVRELLQGKANVYRLYCNGGESASVVGKVSQMQKTMRDDQLDDPWTFKWDVIQFNVGLHDLKYMKNNKLDVSGEQVTSLEQYAKNLRVIIGYLKHVAPEAKLIFVTTTPVPENSSGRKHGDAARYNEVALEVMKDYPEITVNDLYAFTLPHQQEWWQKPGNVHYAPAGRQAQGKEVAGVIENVLAQE